MPYKDPAKRREHYAQNKEKYLARNRRWYAKLKIETFKHYSPNLVCQRCGFNDLRALTIDHIDGGGVSHRKVLSKIVKPKPGTWAPGTWYFYRWLRSNGYPPGYRVLCMNCQFITHFEHAECSHYQQELAAEFE